MCTRLQLQLLLLLAHSNIDGNGHSFTSLKQGHHTYLNASILQTHQLSPPRFSTLRQEPFTNYWWSGQVDHNYDLLILNAF